MTVPAIQISGLCKDYGTGPVLRDVALDVAEGEFFGLIGDNGAGKTTLMKCLLDLAGRDAGQAHIFGIDAGETRARERLAFLPERFTPPYYLRGRDFLDYMAALYRVRPEPRQVESMLAVLAMMPAALEKPVRQLSKGMAQKLGIIACLVSGRPLLVMDEPMSGLDPKARALLKSHLRSLKGRGTTLFFTTHLLDDAQALCDRVAILHDGRIGFAGSPAECCTHYGTDDFEQAYLRCVGIDS